jgi:uncharacterized protein (DUF4415 family)
MKDNDLLLDSKVEDDAEFSDPYNIPDDFWDNAVIEEHEPKEAVSIRLNHFVLDYFKRQGRGYQSRINAVLRHYVLTKLMDEIEDKGRLTVSAHEESPTS